MKPSVTPLTHVVEVGVPGAGERSLLPSGKVNANDEASSVLEEVDHVAFEGAGERAFRPGDGHDAIFADVGGHALRDGYGVFDSVEFYHVCSPQYT